MKVKSFRTYLEKRLNKSKIAEIERIAKLEAEFLESLQEAVSKAVAKYMADEEIGFNELVRRLNISPTQASKIQSGEANLTLASVAHICALLKMKPRLVINDKRKAA
ncbi:helix-turn-helix domain-containing protein [Coxiella burnetii]|uniref:HTH cro/C1-type domain-containing protein n=2 Tax=Coxiella burnetii TaxID=777 RepID=Q83EN0_COXBU|nr:helix-turn-helix transcriptional regulator [Coxiella burnetii]NP_819329.1 hypothetical protein CBU_0285 [Coxiella burnetii RSA 493]AAO89843.1 hypothetical protein CBU_0285 [Coxiella burnetii RSA 493]ABX77540.1 conserved hypothetical protein [Coxiella burnetii RSA 331]ACJ18997.1 hypothetical protein CbuG_1722 [Coxiella burnetii CbuG_Q212]ARI65182.1 hypothetical protein B7L74_01490 [Coxiella burnetii]ARK26673.1 hypothetical protein BMW92_01440 [Coxiella burnetii]